MFLDKKENKSIKHKILTAIRNRFEHEEEDYCKSLRVVHFWSNGYIEYKSKGDRKTLSVKKYINKIRPYLKDIINDLKKSDTWKIQLTITINFISSKDDSDEERAMYSKSDNIEIMNNAEADEVIEELFKSLHSKYQNNLEESMKGNEFVFKYVHLLYYKCLLKYIPIVVDHIQILLIV